MMDDRKQRLGEYAADDAPRGPSRAPRPVPDDPAIRQDWERKASSIAAYREMYGYDHPDHPIGPEPTRDMLDQRAAWHELCSPSARLASLTSGPCVTACGG